MISLPGLAVVEVLHDGARTEVVRCRRDDGATVVVKALKSPDPSPDEVAQLKHEHDLARSLDPVAVVRPLALERHGGGWHLLLEDLGGSSLGRRLGGRALPLADFFPLALKVVAALATVHRGQVIHKDVKPDNLIVSDDLTMVRLTDFGVAVRVGREAAEAIPTRLEGTLAYLSPEQTGRTNRTVDFRADHYSLGVTLFELLTGRRPFPGDDPVALIHCHLARPAPSPRDLDPTIPDGLSRVVAKLLAKAAEERYQSLPGLAADLEHCWREWRETGAVAPFALAAHDWSDRFRVAQKHYGRQAEEAALVAALERTATGAAEVVVVSGPPGIGKSALVREIVRPITARRGFFIAGSFDRLERSSPHSTLVETLADLVSQLLTLSDNEIAGWRQELSAALAGNGRVLTRVIPAVELVIGPQPELPELGPVEAQNRFNLVLHDFVSAFARPEAPLAIVLDDVQWADPGSLHLLELLMTDRYRQHLLLVLAGRGEATVGSGLLEPLLAAVARAGIAVTRVALGPLDRADTAELVADTLHRPLAEVAALADSVFAKAGGNPFFTRELLEALHGDGLVRFDPVSGRWVWELERIAEHDVADNVAGLLTGRLDRLPAATRDLLAVAACVGTRFAADTLVVVAASSPEAVQEALRPAVEAGLVLPLGHAHGLAALTVDGLAERPAVELRFAHDRIQQAVYERLDPAERARRHRRIGDELLRATGDADDDPRLFAAVTQLDLARHLLVDPAERERLAALNLRAGERALAATAYEQAARLLFIGVELLDGGSWQHRYDLALALHQRAAQASFLVHDRAALDRLAAAVLANARGVLDAVPAWETIIQAHIAAAELGEALTAALRLFAALGIRFPRRATVPAILVALVATRLRLAGRQAEDLGRLGTMDDPRQRAALRTLMRVSTAVYVSAPEWMPLLVFKGVDLTVGHGLAAESAFALAGYGIVECGVLGRVREGYRFGQLALQLVDRFAARELEARVQLVNCMLIRHWLEPVRDTAAGLLEGYRAGLATGDLEFAAHCIRGYCFTIFASGTPLPTVEAEMRRASKAIAQLGQQPLLLVHGSWQQAVANLRGDGADPCRLDGEHFAAATLVPSLETTNNRLALCDYHLNRMILLVLFDRADEALDHACRARRVLDGITSAASVPIFHFYDALIRLRARPGRLGLGSALRVADDLRRLRRWARLTPANHAHRVLLVEAERCRVRGHQARAIDLYERAISTARDHQYVQEAALAAELASRYHRAAGRQRMADVYWEDARAAYLSWGAEAKVRALDVEAAARGGRPRPAEARRSPSRSAVSATTGDGGRSLDLAAVIGASQAISGELEHDRLVTAVLRAVMANAGADRAALVLNRDGRLLVEAIAEGGGETIHSGLGTSAEASDELPASVLQYVARTRDSLVLAEASATGLDGLFAADPYLRRRGPRSLLCVPLVHRGQLVGLLHLENTLAPDAFTAARVEVASLLGTQAAISIANARALASRAEQERLRLEAEFLAARNRELASLNAAKDRLFSIISHDLRAPFNPLLVFAEILAAGATTLPPERVKRLADRVLLSARTVYNLLENLLEWARIQTDRVELRPERTPLAPLVGDAFALLAANAEGKGIALRLEVADELEARVDRTMIATVVRNLVANAIKFTAADGTVTVSATATAAEVELAVADTGVGMAPEVAHQLFDSATRHSTPGTANEGGTGLGLILCRELVERHGGRIWAVSAPGQGSTFHVVLPRA